MHARGLASDPGVPAEVELIRLRGGACSTTDVNGAITAMREAGEPDGLVARRFAQGDEFIAWRAGSRIACFGWITHGQRQVGALRLTARTSTAYLYNFHTFPWARARGLYTALLLQARYQLRSTGVDDLVIDANERNRPSIRGMQTAGFAQMATVSFLTLFDRWNIAGSLVPATQADSILHALVR